MEGCMRASLMEEWVKGVGVRGVWSKHVSGCVQEEEVGMVE